MHNPFFNPHNSAQKTPHVQVENQSCANRVSQGPKTKKKFPIGFGHAQTKKGLAQAKSGVYTG
jgi:hypothetical protein